MMKQRRENQLEEMNRSLERRVAEAVAELRRKDQILIQQNRLAGVGEIISNIAHQWRQPLNVVGGIIQNVQLSLESGNLDRKIWSSNSGMRWTPSSICTHHRRFSQFLPSRQE